LSSDKLTVRDKVIKILKYNKFARNDDLTLIFAYYFIYEKTIISKVLVVITELLAIRFGLNNLNLKGSKLTAPSTIIRERRFIQDENNGLGLYLADKQTQKARATKQDSFKYEYSGEVA